MGAAGAAAQKGSLVQQTGSQGKDGWVAAIVGEQDREVVVLSLFAGLILVLCKETLQE